MKNFKKLLKNTKKKPVKESTFQHRVLHLLHQIPNLFAFAKEAGSIRGLPDIIGVYNGLFFGLELKRTAKECASKSSRLVLQKYRGEQIQKAGGYFALVNPDNLLQILEELKEFRPHS